jgi:hypothetical protein
MLLTRTAGTTNNYSNDSDGNTLSDGTRTNSWDSENRLGAGSDGQRIEPDDEHVHLWL